MNETESWALKSAASVIDRQLVAFVELDEGDAFDAAEGVELPARCDVPDGRRHVLHVPRPDVQPMLRGVVHQVAVREAVRGAGDGPVLRDAGLAVLRQPGRGGMMAGQVPDATTSPK